MGSDLLRVGRVARVHGIKGHVVVSPDTDFMEDRFRAGQVLLIGPADGTREYEVRDVRFHQGRPIVALAGVETIEDAEPLAGSDVWLPEARIAPLPEGTFYRHDLVGCAVHDTRGTLLGLVTAVEGTLERSCLVVEQHLMIPLVGEIVLAVDIAGRRVTVDPPEGLLDLNRRPEK